MVRDDLADGRAAVRALDLVAGVDRDEPLRHVAALGHRASDGIGSFANGDVGRGRRCDAVERHQVDT